MNIYYLVSLVVVKLTVVNKHTQSVILSTQCLLTLTGGVNNCHKLTIVIFLQCTMMYMFLINAACCCLS